MEHKFVKILFTWHFACLLLSITTCNEEQARVGIIGAGVGGASAAYFIRELFGDNVKIDIYEKQHVGGRLAPVMISEESYNAGGTIIHPANMYMVNFTDLLGLKRDTHPEPGRLGIYDGNELVFSTSDYAAVTMGKLFWRYGMDIYNVRNWVKDKILPGMHKLYDFQRDGHAYSNVEDLLNAMDPDFVEYTKKSVKEVLKDQGFGDKFIDEFAQGAMRNNYGQTTVIQGLVGGVSMAGVEPGLWNVVGGNHLVPQGLVRKANANLIRAKVTGVSLTSDSPAAYQVDYLPSKSTDEDDISSKEYDIVILAAPFYKGKDDIKFEDFQNPMNPVDYGFHQTIATFIEGEPNPEFLHYSSLDDWPSAVFCTNTSVFFNSLNKMKPLSGNTPKKPVYRFFSNQVPTIEQIKQLTPEHLDLRVVNWDAYPEYPSAVNLPSFCLHEQLYHVNAIEMAASAMEMSVVGAKNVALLAYYRYTGQYDKIDEVISKSESTEKTEL